MSIQRFQTSLSSASTWLIATAILICSINGSFCDQRSFHEWTKSPTLLKCKAKEDFDHPIITSSTRKRFRRKRNQNYVWTQGGITSMSIADASRRIYPSTDFETGIPPLESAYMKERSIVSETEFHEYALRAGIRKPGDSSSAGKCTITAPKIGVAISGGSIRSYLNAAGVLSAMDRRTPGSMDAGTGGLLQSLSYIAGESGGAWLLGSWFAQGNPAFSDMLDSIHLNESITFPGGKSDLPFFGYVISETLKAAVDKKEKGFNISLADIYSGLISQQLLPDESNVPFHIGESGLTLSSLSKSPSVQNYSVPLPIMISLQKDKQTSLDGIDSCPPANIWEWSIFESGTFGGNARSFVRSDMIGNELTDGKLTSKDCVSGADNLPWVLATATAAYSQAAHKDSILSGLERCMNSTSIAARTICALLKNNVLDLSLDRDSERTHLTSPAQAANPFARVSSVSNNQEDEIYFTDVGPCEQIPLFSLLQQGRELDVVFALDATEGTTSWPNGLALSISASHARHVGLSVPDTPNLEEFSKQKNLTTKASFFGCYDDDAPAIVYIPNHMVSFASNVSYSKLKWTREEQHAMLQNGFGQLTEDDLPVCLSCLLASRQHRDCSVKEDADDFWMDSNREQCEQCFEKYCWRTPKDHKLDQWERASKAVDDINRSNLERLISNLFGN